MCFLLLKNSNPVFRVNGVGVKGINFFLGGENIRKGLNAININNVFKMFIFLNL